MIPRSALESSPGAAGPVLGAESRWWHRAACLGEDSSLFFADPDDSPLMIAQAKALCAVCAVRIQCLDEALATADTHSVRGGMTWPERRPLLPPPARCASGRHPRTGPGACADCRRERLARKREEERVIRTGSASPRSGRRRAA